jgi:hypothetical protein
VYAFWHFSKKRSNYLVYGTGIASLKDLYSMKKSVEGIGRNYKVRTGLGAGRATHGFDRLTGDARRGVGKERGFCRTGGVPDWLGRLD